MHFLWIASSMLRLGEGEGMWDEEDGFFYDVLRLPDGRSQRLKVRSLVGLLPLCAVIVFEGELIEKIPEARAHLRKFLEARPELIAQIHHPSRPSRSGRRLAAVLNEVLLRRVFAPSPEHRRKRLRVVLCSNCGEYIDLTSPENTRLLREMIQACANVDEATAARLQYKDDS